MYLFDQDIDFNLLQASTPLPQLSCTQSELLEKFNAAFYDAQNLNRSNCYQEQEQDDFLDTFDESFFSNIEEYEEESDCFVDYFASRYETESTVTTPSSDATSTFDYTELSESFEETIFSFPYDETTTSYTNQESSSDASNHSPTMQPTNENPFSQFFVQPPFEEAQQVPNLPLDRVVEENDLVEEFDLKEVLSFALDDNYEVGDMKDQEIFELEDFEEAWEKLPPVNSITKSQMDFNKFLRNVPENSIYEKQENELIGTKPTIASIPQETTNHMVQLQDDPMLSSTSIMYPYKLKQTSPESSPPECCSDEDTMAENLQCQWEDCYQIYANQSSLVRHIEKCHVELKRGEEFTCYWVNCPRKTKPFNARYKLLIHMRVHSGEKPNKCPFKGCNKAFSRLENLKIHQRSHTGERPYLCQFSNCTKSFSNSSDRAKHQRTHFDTKPYACQVYGCLKKYTDPSSLRKHVKNHTYEEQMELKKRNAENQRNEPPKTPTKKYNNNKETNIIILDEVRSYYPNNLDHSYSNQYMFQDLNSYNIKMDLKNKISEKSRYNNFKGTRA